MQSTGMSLRIEASTELPNELRLIVSIPSENRSGASVHEHRPPGDRKSDAKTMVSNKNVRPPAQQPRFATLKG